MTNAIDVAQGAVNLWRQYHGNESLHNQCQRYDGYYWQWAYQGNDNIATYSTAQLAADNSVMFTTSINDPAIQTGDLLYWWYGSAGHVGTVVGRDGGRVLVTQTANTGDNLKDLGNNVKVSHADTLALSFRGASHTNGRNIQRTGLASWDLNTGGGTPAGGGGTGQIVDLGSQSWYWYKSAGEAERHQNVHGGKYTGEGMLSGPYPVLSISGGGAINVQSQSVGNVWLAPEAQAYITGGTAPAPVQRTINLTSPWYWYNSADDAQATRNVHGGKYTGEPMLSGKYNVIQIAGNGAIQVRANDGSGPWLNSAASPYLS